MSVILYVKVFDDTILHCHVNGHYEYCVQLIFH